MPVLLLLLRKSAEPNLLLSKTNDGTTRVNDHVGRYTTALCADQHLAIHFVSEVLPDTEVKRRFCTSAHGLFVHLWHINNIWSTAITPIIHHKAAGISGTLRAGTRSGMVHVQHDTIAAHQTAWASSRESGSPATQRTSQRPHGMHTELCLQSAH